MVWGSKKYLRFKTLLLVLLSISALSYGAVAPFEAEWDATESSQDLSPSESSDTEIPRKKTSHSSKRGFSETLFLIEGQHPDLGRPKVQRSIHSHFFHLLAGITPLRI